MSAQRFYDTSTIWQPVIDELTKLVTAAAIVVGGIWAYRRFYVEREHRERIEFTIDGDMVDLLNDTTAVSVVVKVVNTGKVLACIEETELSGITVERFRTSDCSRFATSGTGEVNWTNLPVQAIPSLTGPTPVPIEPGESGTQEHSSFCRPKRSWLFGSLR